MFSFIDTELRLHGHPSLTPSLLVENVGPLVNVHCVMWHAPSSPEAKQVKFCMWGTSSRIVVSTQKLEVLPLVIHTVNHLFEVTVISVIFRSFFFFESLPYTQAGISTVCSVILSSRMLFGKTENKTKWINLQIKKKQWKPKPKQTTKIQPVQLTTQTVAVSFAWKWPQSRGKQEKEFSVSHVSYFTPKNIKYESIKI